MRFTVLWTPGAEAQLAVIWTEASDRDVITKLADAIDATLASNPLDAGESRYDNIRLLLNLPLGVLYDVSVDDRKVIVWHVWCVPKRQKP